MRRLVSLLLAGGLAVSGAPAAGCSRPPEGGRPSSASPSSYIPIGSDIEGFRARGREVGNLEQAAKVLPFRPATLTDPLGRSRKGTVVVTKGSKDGPEYPLAKRRLFEFFDGFEFQQWRFSSPREAAEVVEAAKWAPAGFTLETTVDINGHKGYAWDPVRPGDGRKDRNGKVIDANIPYSKVIWADGDMVYTLESWDGVPYAELLRAARSVRPAE